MKTTKNILIVLFLLSFNFSFSQTVLDTICWIKVDSAYLPNEDTTNTAFTNNSTVNAILENNGVNHYELALFFSDIPILRKIIEIRCNNCNIDSLNIIVETNFPNNSFYDFEKYSIPDSTIKCYTLADQG